MASGVTARSSDSGVVEKAPSATFAKGALQATQPRLHKIISGLVFVAKDLGGAVIAELSH